MIPNSYSFKNYDELPQLSLQQILKLIQKGQEFVFYDQLIVRVNEFNHPGNNTLIKPFVNNININIKEQFAKYLHSGYAQLILTLRSIGKFHSQRNSYQTSQKQNLEGKYIFQKVVQSKEFVIHQRAIQKIDFAKPVWDQLNQLTIEQKQILTQVPTKIETQHKILFKNTPWEQFMYTDNFLLSTSFFIFCILATGLYFFNQWTNGVELISCIPFFLIGLLKWTFLEYYFHRFQYHNTFLKRPQIGDHLMHHIFPNIKTKLSLSVIKICSYMIGFWILYSLFLETNQKVALLLGILVGLTLYDILHYYFHFGPETNIGWINNLKRNHLKHHYRDSNKGFGVSTILWDKIFGTEHTTLK